MHYRLITLFSVIAFFSNAQAFSLGEDTPEQELNAQVILELLESSDSLILSIENEKVFIESGKIFPTDHGLFLRASGKNIRLPYLQSNQSGCYISCSQMDSIIYPMITCEKCGKVFNPNIFNLGKCPRCGHQN